uniref:ATP synthase complex subunit 8 n=1 Tax=Byrsotria sp. B018 TaxID=2093459 RepID=A0A2P1H750_9NEOP|nr:ATP synthase F0 subunit 8 [Byrsotria sp. B018]
MPQMMPLSWLSMYMFFIITLMLFSLINYFSFIINPLPSSKIIKIESLSWKW